MPQRPDPSDGPHDILAAEEFGVGAADSHLRDIRPHDVLAAEEFVVPAPDPGLRDIRPHDVLAAEEFVVPAPDPVLHHHGPIALPEDPAGRPQARDILAAEEYAMPAPPRPATSRRGAAPGSHRGQLLAGLVLGLAVAVRRRARRRG